MDPFSPRRRRELEVDAGEWFDHNISAVDEMARRSWLIWYLSIAARDWTVRTVIDNALPALWSEYWSTMYTPDDIVDFELHVSEE